MRGSGRTDGDGSLTEPGHDFTEVVTQEWRVRLGWDRLSAEQRAAVAEWGLHMYGLAAPVVEDIDDVKYDGRLVVLDDGSRWEVAAYDSNVADTWTYLTKVAVIDDVMYNLTDAEHVDVTEE